MRESRECVGQNPVDTTWPSAAFTTTTCTCKDVRAVESLVDSFGVSVFCTRKLAAIMPLFKNQTDTTGREGISTDPVLCPNAGPFKVGARSIFQDGLTSSSAKAAGAARQLRNNNNQTKAANEVSHVCSEIWM